ncbi:hypothetical protein K4039_23465 [Lyngbya sp. CCAP 1446/10]|uniref:hypothetical protein n=1 Tax=Lyngbya sp. CCAP 1446/10 TaxID=439293 RepID=UPI0022385C16|nr:hypothetical protein [Lyngbya sp. CCAP 1446/10]MCW6052948.1 hypothetical protein [Lyngbya sp. CCAP 1446/10]
MYYQKGSLFLLGAIARRLVLCAIALGLIWHREKMCDRLSKCFELAVILSHHGLVQEAVKRLQAKVKNGYGF